MIIGIMVACQTANGESVHVDGVLVYGRIHEISTKDIHEAIADLSISDEKPFALEVISSREIHAYESWDLGWNPACYCDVHEPGGSIQREWMFNGMNIVQTSPELFQFIKSTNAIYIFPLPSPDEPRRDDKHLRLLDHEVQQELVHLLGDPKNWVHGGYEVIGSSTTKDPPSVGILFRRGSSEVVMFFSSNGEFMHGTFMGKNMSGVLESRRPLQEWKARHAGPELGIKSH